MRRKLLFHILLGLLSLQTYAAHIVGGEMFYECLGGDNYLVTLKVYRDCFSFGPNVAGFDDPAWVTVYDASGIEVITVFPDFTGPTNIPPETNNPCLTAPANVCVEEGIFTFTTNLPPIAGGYDIVYQRCCRNSTIRNIVSPSQVGATYIARIPDPTIVNCNSSPEFVDFPPIAICANEPLIFDHSAIDPDGDRLVYEFCTPYVGASTAAPQPTPAPPGPYSFVSYMTGFTAGFPISSSPSITIDPNTGLITGTPTTAGQYVVGVCVKEYRGTVLVGESRRDFQFNVVPCVITLDAIVPIIDTTGAAATNTTGLFFNNCDGFDVDFINNSVNATSYHWDFGVPNTNADTSDAFEPSYVFPDTGIYVVTLVANPGFSCADTTSVYVRIFPIFRADFDVISDCEGRPLQFSDESFTTHGVVDSWRWSFNDGTFSTDENPMHTYATSGTFDVSLFATNSKGCESFVTKPVDVYSKPDPDFRFSPPCVNTPVLLINFSTILDGSAADWQWDYGNGNTSSNREGIQDYAAPGTYNVTLIGTTDKGCQDSITLPVTINPLPTINAFADTTICANEPVQLLATGGNNYVWSPATALSSSTTNAPIASPSTTTEYKVTGIDTNECRSQDSIIITVQPKPNTTANNDTLLCLGEPLLLSGANGINFWWYENGAQIGTTADLLVTPSDTTTYILESVNQFNCFNYDTVEVTVQHPIDMDAGGDTEICIGESAQLTSSGGLYYEWVPALYLNNPDIPNPVSTPDETITYVVNISNDCFADSQEVQVVVNPLPLADAGPDDSILRDEIIPMLGNGGADYLWIPGDGLVDTTDPNTDASPFNTQTYVLRVTDGNGCINYDTVTIFVEVIDQLLIPNAFSPNGDGLNDIFRITKQLNVEELLEFNIYNRWGTIVYSGNDLDRGWDGTYNGEPQDIAVFNYYVKVLNRDGIKLTYKGNVTLIR